MDHHYLVATKWFVVIVLIANTAPARLPIVSAVAIASDSGGRNTVVSLSTLVSYEGASVTLVCSFAASPPFGSSSSELALVKYQHQDLFTAADLSKLAPYTDSPAAQPIEMVDTGRWGLNQPWSDYSQRYNQTVVHNDTSVTFRFIHAIAEDTGYYGCKFQNAYSVFRPLVVYAKDIPVNGTLSYGSQVLLANSSQGELTLEYSSTKSGALDVAIWIDSLYASLPFSARLFSGRSLSQFSLVYNQTESRCLVRALCVYPVRFLVQIVLVDVHELHLDQLTLQVGRPEIVGTDSGAGADADAPPLWRQSVRLLDSTQDAAVVSSRGLVCSTSPAPLSSTSAYAPMVLRTRHGEPASLACSVPRLWLSLPGYLAYWSVESAVQFYPVGRVACAYPPEASAASSTTAVDDNMVDLPDGLPGGGDGSCRGNKFRPLLEANFAVVAAGESAPQRLEYIFRVPAAYYVHSGRRVFFRVAVGDARFRASSAANSGPPEQEFGIEIETDVNSARSWVRATPVWGYLLVPAVVTVQQVLHLLA